MKTYNHSINQLKLLMFVYAYKMIVNLSLKLRGGIHRYPEEGKYVSVQWKNPDEGKRTGLDAASTTRISYHAHSRCPTPSTCWHFDQRIRGPRLYIKSSVTRNSRTSNAGPAQVHIVRTPTHLVFDFSACPHLI